MLAEQGLLKTETLTEHDKKTLQKMGLGIERGRHKFAALVAKKPRSTSA